MSLPVVLLRQVEERLGVTVTGQHAAAGGCISPAARIMLADGGSLFVKAAPGGAPADMMVAEAASLRALRSAAAGTGGEGQTDLRVPEVLATGSGWLALEWLEATARPRTRDWRALGAGLARLHRTSGGGWGWETDNYIGPLAQSNAAAADWACFWRDRRLLPQLRLAGQVIDKPLARSVERLADRLDELLAPAAADGASLLHGDLWHGNVLITGSGPALIDPASYRGHREVDLAMAALFGGLEPTFERAYIEEWPLERGAARRRAVYQLYYLLVHVNLFGASYIGRTRAAVESALGQT